MAAEEHPSFTHHTQPRPSTDLPLCTSISNPRTTLHYFIIQKRKFHGIFAIKSSIYGTFVPGTKVLQRESSSIQPYTRLSLTLTGNPKALAKSHRSTDWLGRWHCPLFQTPHPMGRECHTSPPYTRCAWGASILEALFLCLQRSTWPPNPNPGSAPIANLCYTDKVT